MRIVFMGTPEFARASLAAIIDGNDICGVFTQPDRAKGRGMKVVACPVKQLAEEAGIAVFQPVKLRDGSALELLRSLKPDLIVVVAYGRILPKEILELPEYGCINVHASLLPELRGAAPIQWAIAKGYKKTGVTTMYLAEETDAGDILMAQETPVGEREDAGSLHDRLSIMGAELLKKTIAAIEQNKAVRTPQQHSQATFAPILRKEDGVIDLSRPLREVDCLIRGMNPWPGAVLGSLKIHKARPAEKASGAQFITCGDGGILELLEVQAPGGRRMSAADYFLGHRAL